MIARLRGYLLGATKGFVSSVPRLAWVILACHFCLGVTYSLVTPIWEGHDETGHYDYVRYLVQHQTFPPPGGKISQWLDQAHQPPLYYVLTAVLTSWVDIRDNLEPQVNIYAWDGTGRGGYNIVLHDPQVESFPYRGTVLAFHLARLVSVALGTLTVLTTFKLAQAVWPERKDIALGAMAIVAFNPLFIFMGSLVNNDILIAFMAAWVLLWLVKSIQAPRMNWRLIVALGVASGLALLTKNNALALIPLVGLGLLLPLVWRRWKLWSTLQAGVLWGGTTLLVCGGWYTRNLMLFGTLFPDRAEDNIITRQVDPIVKALEQNGNWPWFATMLQNTFYSFWGYFGWGNVHISDGWVYYALLAGVALAGGGLIIFLWRNRPVAVKWSVGLLALSLVLVMSLTVYRAIFFHSPYLVSGRYLLPAIAAIGILLSIGLAELFSSGRWRIGWYGLAGALFVLAVVTPFRYIAPAYAYPARLSPDTVKIEHPVYITYGEQLELLGYQFDSPRLIPGQELRVTLYWRALKKMDQNYTFGLHILAPDLTSLGSLNTYPGPGTYPTSFWQPGEIIRDTYRVPLSSDAPVPLLGQLKVGVFVPQASDLPTHDQTGQPVYPYFGRLKLAAPVAPHYAIPQATHFTLGDTLVLAGYGLTKTHVVAGEAVPLDLFWQTDQPVGADYTVFVHLLDASGNSVHSWDEQPMQGKYPTSLWDGGELVRDTHVLAFPATLAPGKYTLYTGMYLLETLERLPAQDAQGQPVLNDAIKLTDIEVVAGSK